MTSKAVEYAEIYDCRPDFEAREKLLDTLLKSYPFITRCKIGVSLCHRPVYAYSIGNPDRKVLYAGAFHGMEWLTSLVLIKFLEDCAVSIKENTEILCFRMYDFLVERGLWIIPCVNPDGVEIQLNGSKSAGGYKRLVDTVSSDTSKWQSNARGVDINHNFAAGWQTLKRLEIKSGITKPGPTRYGGKHPESEPESRCIANLCRKENFCRAYAFHSQGREIYRDFGKISPENSRLIADILADAAKYTVSAPTGLAVGGGFKDWFVSCFKRPAFTVEIGIGENPLPTDILKDEYRRLLPLLCLGAIL